MARTKPTAAQIAEAEAAAAARERGATTPAHSPGSGSISSLSEAPGSVPPQQRLLGLLARWAPRPAPSGGARQGGWEAAQSAARPPSGSPPAAAPPSPDQYSPASGGILCRYGAACYRPDCLFKHPPRTYVAQAPACRDGWHCTRKDCGFTHPAGVREDVELPFAARNVILGNGGCVVQEIRRRVRDARIHIETDFDAERMVAEIKAMTPAALEHAREYLQWAAFSMVRRGFNPNKDILRTKEGQLSQCRSRYEGAIRREKKRRRGRKLRKAEKREATRMAAAYVVPPAPRFINESEWDRFVVASERTRRAPTHPLARSRKRRQRYVNASDQRADEFYARCDHRGEFYARWVAAAERAAERDSRNCSRDDSRSRSRSRSRDASYDSYEANEAYNSYESEDSDYDERICGFSPGDAEELMCQGVKPWDDDAGDVLAALYY